MPTPSVDAEKLSDLRARLSTPQTAHDLAVLVGTSERTIYRWFLVLEEQGDVIARFRTPGSRVALYKIVTL